MSAKLQVDIKDQKPSSNVLSIGGLIYRYKKNSRKNTTTQCEIQAAFIYERLNELHLLNGGRQPRKRLCTILDVYSGELTKAPGNAKRQFKNLKNGCLNIKDQWDSLPPPRNAVLK